MKFLKIFKSYQKKVKKYADLVLEMVALQIVFWVGIGLTKIVAKFFFKNFLERDYYFTSWKKNTSKNNISKMF